MENLNFDGTFLCTTPEQGEHLIELGLPKLSSDCYWGLLYKEDVDSDAPAKRDLHFRQNKVQLSDKCYEGAVGRLCTPAWSAGQLIHIYEEVTRCSFGRTFIRIDLIEEIIYRIEKEVIPIWNKENS